MPIYRNLLISVKNSSHAVFLDGKDILTRTARLNGYIHNMHSLPVVELSLLTITRKAQLNLAIREQMHAVSNLIGSVSGQKIEHQ